MREITTMGISTMDPWTWIGIVTGTITTRMITTGITTSEMSVMRDVLKTLIVNTVSASVNMDISRSGEDARVIGELKTPTVTNTDQTILILSRLATLPGTAKAWT